MQGGNKKKNFKISKYHPATLLSVDLANTQVCISQNPWGTFLKRSPLHRRWDHGLCLGSWRVSEGRGALYLRDHMSKHEQA